MLRRPVESAQFTGQAFTGVLLKTGIAISMDGKGAWRDYLRAYDSVGEARASIGRHLTFYNGRKPHSSLDRMTPDQAYFNRLPQPAAA